ncbi:MAG TPA: AraC family transcriptional regulator [Steroidobacteraceae bacterium]|nr:AraC family transcriptional regulator [Steroidobacteraceae bacterium]
MSDPVALIAVARASVRAHGPQDASAAGHPIRIAYLTSGQRSDLPPLGDRIEVLLPSKDAIVETDYCISGAVTKTTPIRGARIVITPAGASHPTYCARRSDALVIALDPDFYRDSVRGALGCEALEIVQGYNGVDPVLREIGDILRAELRFGRVPSAMYLECWARVVALHLAITYGQPPTRRSPGLPRTKLKEILGFIQRHLADSIQVEDLANTACLSPYHFARLFKRAIGQSPHLYITAQRMQRAKEVLSDSDLPLVDVAACVGFRTQAHFTGVFRRYSGLTPRAYRLSNRASAPHVEPITGEAPAPS